MTNPVQDIIPREISNEDVKDLFNKFATCIEELVNFGSQILKWDLDTIKGGDENLPIVLSFRHFLELIDSISILVKHSSIDPCNLILRGALETYFGLEYIFEKNTTDRSMAFLVWNAHNSMKVYRKFDATSEQGKQLQNILNNDRSINGMKLKYSPLLNPAIKSLENLLQSPDYQKVEKEFQRLKKNGVNNPEWYRLFNGPRNIQELSAHLKLSALYEFLYRPWSGQVHGTEVVQGKYRTDDKNVEIFQIRYPKDAQIVTSYALTLSLMAFSSYIKFRIPSKKQDYKDWYTTHRELFYRIAGKDQLLTYE